MCCQMNKNRLCRSIPFDEWLFRQVTMGFDNTRAFGGDHTCGGIMENVGIGQTTHNQSHKAE